MKTLELTEFDHLKYDENGIITEWAVYSEHLLAHVPADLNHIRKWYKTKYRYARDVVQMCIDLDNQPFDIIEPDEAWIKRTYE